MLNRDGALAAGCCLTPLGALGTPAAVPPQGAWSGCGWDSVYVPGRPSESLEGSKNTEGQRRTCEEHRGRGGGQSFGVCILALFVYFEIGSSLKFTA